jgi:hypothetical protein
MGNIEDSITALESTAMCTNEDAALHKLGERLVTLLDDACAYGRVGPCLRYVIPDREQFFYTDLGNT